MKIIRTTEGYMVEQDDGDYLCDEHGDNTWETRLEAESVMDIAQGGKGFMLPQIQPQLEINMNTAPDNNPVHEAVQFYWGKRCPEHEDGCPTCEAWRQYDDMMQGTWAWHEAKAKEYDAC